MTKHIFLIVDKATGEVIARDSTTAYGEWVGALLWYIIHLYDTGKYKTQKLVHLAPNPENCRTFTDEQIIRFSMQLGAAAP